MLKESTAVTARCRVWIQSVPCLFGTSVFDTLSKVTTKITDCQHYDRTSVFLKEEDENIALEVENSNHTHPNNGIIHGLPFGRARNCPTKVLER